MVRSRPQVLFDATRLLGRAERAAPTGIDRVCLAYAEHLLARDGIRLIPLRGRRDGFVAIEPQWFADRVMELRRRWSGEDADPAVATRLISNLSDPRLVRLPAPATSAPSGRGRRALERILSVRPLPPLEKNALYVGVGHTGLDESRPLRDLIGRGARAAVMIHDLIPVSHPEYCRPGEATRHRARVRAALRLSDRIMVNSRTTADALHDFAAREGLAPPPVAVLKLGVEPVFGRPGWAPAPHPWFVHVGTLEARKNLTFILTLWRRLEERLGEAAPRLLLIGRHGWENESILGLLQRSPNLQGVAHQTADLPDEALAQLLRGSRGLLAPSQVEGFDLPPIEARAMGVPVLASDIAAHRELLSGARLLDPLDGPAWLAAIEALMTPGRPPAPVAAPNWAEHFDAFDAFVGLS